MLIHVTHITQISLSSSIITSIKMWASLEEEIQILKPNTTLSIHRDIEFSAWHYGIGAVIPTYQTRKLKQRGEVMAYDTLLANAGAGIWIPGIWPQTHVLPWRQFGNTFKRHWFICFIYLLFFSVLGIQSRVAHMLGKCSTTGLHPQPRSLWKYLPLLTYFKDFKKLLASEVSMQAFFEWLADNAVTGMPRICW
jgi:hypothetical protein